MKHLCAPRGKCLLSHCGSGYDAGGWKGCDVAADLAHALLGRPGRTKKFGEPASGLAARVSEAGPEGLKSRGGVAGLRHAIKRCLVGNELLLFRGTVAGEAEMAYVL